MCAISPQAKEISRKLIQQLGLIFNFRGGYHMKKINSRTFFTQTLKFFGIVYRYMCAIAPQDQEISKKLIHKLDLIFNFRGGYHMKKINSRTFFTQTLKFFGFLQKYMCAIAPQN